MTHASERPGGGPLHEDGCRRSLLLCFDHALFCTLTCTGSAPRSPPPNRSPAKSAHRPRGHAPATLPPPLLAAVAGEAGATAVARRWHAERQAGLSLLYRHRRPATQQAPAPGVVAQWVSHSASAMVDSRAVASAAVGGTEGGEHVRRWTGEGVGLNWGTAGGT